MTLQHKHTSRNSLRKSVLGLTDIYHTDVRHHILGSHAARAASSSCLHCTDNNNLENSGNRWKSLNLALMCQNCVSCVKWRGRNDITRMPFAFKAHFLFITMYSHSFSSPLFKKTSESDPVSRHCGCHFH